MRTVAMSPARVSRALTAAGVPRAALAKDRGSVRVALGDTGFAVAAHPTVPECVVVTWRDGDPRRNTSLPNMVRAANVLRTRGLVVARASVDGREVLCVTRQALAKGAPAGRNHNEGARQ